MSEPTVPEIARRLDEQARSHARLDEQQRRDREHADQVFVRQDVYQADKIATQGRFRDIVKDVSDLQEARKDGQGWRRTASLTLAVAAIGWLVTIATVLFTVLSR